MVEPGWTESSVYRANAQVTSTSHLYLQEKLGKTCYVSSGIQVSNTTADIFLIRGIILKTVFWEDNLVVSCRMDQRKKRDN